MAKPVELEVAEIVDGMCQRYSCLPSQLLAEDVGVIKMLAIVSEGKVEDESSG